MNFFANLRELWARSGCVPEPKPIEIDLPERPSTSQLAEELTIDPEALKMETHEVGLFDETGDYYPQYSDNPAEMPEPIAPTPLSGETDSPESVPAESSEVVASEGDNKE